MTTIFLCEDTDRRQIPFLVAIITTRNGIF